MTIKKKKYGLLKKPMTNSDFGSMSVMEIDASCAGGKPRKLPLLIRITGVDLRVLPVMTPIIAMQSVWVAILKSKTRSKVNIEPSRLNNSVRKDTKPSKKGITKRRLQGEKQ